jgi:protein involved in polysaccharide export with SLBB domain
VPEVKHTKFVRLDGEFGASGVHRVKDGQRLRDLVREAGGLTLAELSQLAASDPVKYFGISWRY